jgi:two-component system phosphate regulon sensor histidine kinase PhoR
MPPRPFFAKLILVFAALLGLIVATCGGAIYAAGQRAVRAQQVADLRRLAPVVREWLADKAAGGTVDEPTRTRLADASRVLGTRITVVAGDGRVTFDTLVPIAAMDNHNDRPEVVAARAGRDGTSVRTSRSLAEPSVYAAELLDPSKPDGTVVRFSYPERSWPKFDIPVLPVLGGSVLATVLAVGGLWLILQRRWVGPTRGLVRTAERLAAGDWAARADAEGADELQFFSTRLNLVALHTQQQLADLKHQRADLQALVDTLPDPVLATDPGGRVILINLPAARLLALSPDKALGQAVVHVVADDAVLQLFERAGQAKPDGPPAAGDAFAPHASASPAQSPSPSFTREIRLNRDGQWLTFQAVAQVTAAGGVLLVLRDVTALASAVQMKTDFVANASHELRTPIAAIKIAFETLREVYGDDAVQAERCMGIIDGHLRRLEEMLRDLLDLSRVENPNLKPRVKRMQVVDVVAHVRSSLGPMARQKGVDLRLGEGVGRDPELPAAFLCDERLLNLILKNLIENSVKFTPAGGSVTVTFRKATGNSTGNSTGDVEPPVCLSVRDTGAGIPAEHLDRVFERFYQVDPARSGSAGRGTGLGLAIVKHAVNALGGSVRIESVVGQGTTVTCTLPQVAPEVEGGADAAPD